MKLAVFVTTRFELTWSFRVHARGSSPRFARQDSTTMATIQDPSPYWSDDRVSRKIFRAFIGTFSSSKWRGTDEDSITLRRRVGQVPPFCSPPWSKTKTRGQLCARYSAIEKLRFEQLLVPRTFRLMVEICRLTVRNRERRSCHAGHSGTSIVRTPPYWTFDYSKTRYSFNTVWMITKLSEQYCRVW